LPSDGHFTAFPPSQYRPYLLFSPRVRPACALAWIGCRSVGDSATSVAVGTLTSSGQARHAVSAFDVQSTLLDTTERASPPPLFFREGGSPKQATPLSRWRRASSPEIVSDQVFLAPEEAFCENQHDEATDQRAGGVRDARQFIGQDREARRQAA